jgi:chemotaxis signal transduction protein
VRKFYLIANRRFPTGAEWTALPVTGECELTSSVLLPPSAGLPPYVQGLLALESGEIVEVLDLEKLAGAREEAA